MEITFYGKTAMISGAAGYIGQQIAAGFASGGAEELILLDRKETLPALTELADRLGAETGTTVYTADLQKPEEIRSVGERLRESGKHVDILVNCAGINVLRRALGIDETIWDLLMNTNARGAFLLTRTVAEQSLLARQGTIIFISSQHGIVGNPERSAYCPSKAALLGLMRALVAEWSPMGVRINTVSPTWVENDSNGSYLYSGTGRRTMLGRIPLGRYATAKDVADAVLFLASPKAAMINGHNLVVDGGYTAL
jgi:NAD(P)-dependent dehydrogenase (short-subunit alcohol dehydrogenase family)